MALGLAPAAGNGWGEAEAWWVAKPESDIQQQIGVSKLPTSKVVDLWHFLLLFLFKHGLCSFLTECTCAAVAIHIDEGCHFDGTHKGAHVTWRLAHMAPNLASLRPFGWTGRITTDSRIGTKIYNRYRIVFPPFKKQFVLFSLVLALGQNSLHCFLQNPSVQRFSLRKSAVLGASLLGRCHPAVPQLIFETPNLCPGIFRNFRQNTNQYAVYN